MELGCRPKGCKRVPLEREEILSADVPSFSDQQFRIHVTRQARLTMSACCPPDITRGPPDELQVPSFLDSAPGGNPLKHAAEDKVVEREHGVPVGAAQQP